MFVVQETYVKLQHELSLTEDKLRKAHSQGKLLEGDRKTLDKGIAKANNSIKVYSMHVNGQIINGQTINGQVIMSACLHRARSRQPDPGQGPCQGQ